MFWCTVFVFLSACAIFLRAHVSLNKNFNFFPHVADFITPLSLRLFHTRTYTHCTPNRVVVSPHRKMLSRAWSACYITPVHCPNSGLPHSDGTPGCGFVCVCTSMPLGLCVCKFVCVHAVILPTV